MFWHLFHYRIKRLAKDRTVFFWTALFSIVLGTLFFVAFYHAQNDEDANFSAVPTAVYETGTYENEAAFDSFLEEMSTGTDAYLKLIYVDSEAEGEKLLKGDEVAGILQIDKKITLKVSESGFQQTILKKVLDAYLQTENVYLDTASNHPEMMEKVSEILSEQTDYTRNVSFGGKSLNSFITYFYALLAMCMLYGSLFASINASEIMPDSDEIAARRLVAPTHKMFVVLADFLSALTLQMVIYVIVIFYLKVLLGVELGTSWGNLLLIGLAGGMTGVGYGYFVGTVFRCEWKIKDAIIMSGVLTSCFFSGLTVADIKAMMLLYIPLFNKINPATLISDAYYYICIYDNTKEFVRCITTLFAIAVVFCIGSYFALRRRKYASI